MNAKRLQPGAAKGGRAKSGGSHEKKSGKAGQKKIVPRQGTFPSKDDILAFIQEASGPVGKREIARAFAVKGEARGALKSLLGEMKEQGLLVRGHRRRLHRPQELPPVAVLDITGRDEDGEMLARPAQFEGPDEPPAIVIAPGRDDEIRGEPPAGIGDRVLARLTRIDDEKFAYEARIMRRLGEARAPVLGVLRTVLRGEMIVAPVDKKARFDYRVHTADAKDAKRGELVLLETLSASRYGPRRARVIEVLGNLDEPRSVSLIAIHAHGIPNKFPAAVERAAESLSGFDVGKRVDLTDVPLVTIDPSDARDHDDAVWASADDSPSNRGGFRLLVAIADVSAYVTQSSVLDREARLRGNSVYFPDRVVPMLPERISNDLCSLRPLEKRPCLAVEIVIDAQGQRKSYRFVRAVMRSAAKLTYQEAQAAVDGRPNDLTGPLLEPVLRPLYAAYAALARARDARGPLALDLPERRIRLDEQGKVASISVPERLDAHRLIEEFMILANVCAAETLKNRKSPLLYRIHEPPSGEKIAGLHDFLDTLQISLPKGQTLRPRDFNRILAQVAGTEFSSMVNEVVLRSQSQAYYGPQPLGHFGLNLRHYAHFTSPIRRYADLIVHRALIRSLELGPDGLGDITFEELEKLGEDISLCERRAMNAERDTVDRYVAAYMSEHIGAEFAGKIAGVTRFGLFVKLDDTGADGIIPIRTLPNDYYLHDEKAHALIGEKSDMLFRLGAPVTVRVMEAAPVSGGLRFELVEGGEISSGKKHRRTESYCRRPSGSKGQSHRSGKSGRQKRATARRKNDRSR
jgi:ribonuclease R